MNRDNDGPQSSGSMPERIAPRGALPGALLPAGVFAGGMVPASVCLPPGLSYTPNLLTLLKALQRRWLLATTLGLLAAALAASVVWYYFYFHVEVYVARARFWMDETKPVFLMPPDRTKDLDNYRWGQASLVKSLLVSMAALRNPGVAELSLVREQSAPGDWLASALNVDFSSAAEMIVSVSSADRPMELEILLGAVKDAYLDESFASEKGARQDKIDRLRKINRGNEERLRRERRRYQDYVEAQMAVSPAEFRYVEPFAKEMLADLTKDLIRAKRELFKKRLDLGRLEDREKKMDHRKPSKDEVNAALEEEPVVQDLSTQIGEVKAEYEQARVYWRESHPIVRDLQAQLESLEKALADYKTERRPALEEELQNQPLADIMAKLANVREEIWTLEQDEKDTNEEIDRIQSKVELVSQGTAPPSTIIDVDDLKRTIDRLEKGVNVLGDQIDALELENDNVPPRAHWTGELAVGLEVQEEPKLIKYAGMTGAGALALVLLLIAYWEFLAKRIHTGDDVVYGLGWRLVGALPALPNGRGGFLRKKDDKYWQSLLTESVDATRTTLLHAARTEGLRTVMVTSAVSGEGKTSLSCHLAFSLARAGRKTLLIDCDLRSPAAHRLFDLPVSPGFSEVLRGGVGLADVIQQTPAGNLSLIAAGVCDAHTLQSLAHDGLPPILDRLKEQFDFIVIDSSPVLPVVDALVIGQHVDVVIFSLLRNVSRIPNVYAAYQRLATLGIRMLGAVVNGVHKNAYGDSYNYYAKQPTA